MRCALGAVIWLVPELEKKNLNKLYWQKRDMVTKTPPRQWSATHWYPNSFWRNWHKWHMTDHCLLKSGAARSPKHCCPRSPTQYVHVVCTEQALIAVGDSIGTADGAEDLGADQHLFAFIICSVGIRTAVHLSKERTATGWRRHFTFATLILHETATRYNLQWVFPQPQHKLALVGQPGNRRILPAETSPHSRRGPKYWSLVLMFLWALHQCLSVITLSFSTHWLFFYSFFFPLRGARLMTWCVEAGASHSVLFFQ